MNCHGVCCKYSEATNSEFPKSQYGAPVKILDENHGVGQIFVIYKLSFFHIIPKRYHLVMV